MVLLRNTKDRERSVVGVCDRAIVRDRKLLVRAVLSDRVALAVTKVHNLKHGRLLRVRRELEVRRDVARVLTRRGDLEAVVAGRRALPVDDKELIVAIMLVAGLA